MTDETIDSYLARLAEANRLDADALRAHITGDPRKSAAMPTGVLAQISGQPERSLRYALPALGTATERADLNPANRPGSDAPVRSACTLCAAARGHIGLPPRCHSHSHDTVCLLHRRWLGNGLDSDGRQLDLTGQPVIVGANLAHRQFARRHGPTVTNDAYRLAHHVCQLWGDRFERQEQFTALIGALRPGRHQFAVTDTAVHAAHYPQIVAVTRLLLTADWQTAANEQWDRPEYVLRDLRRTATPNPYLRRRRQHRQDAMLIEILLDDPHLPEHAA